VVGKIKGVIIGLWIWHVIVFRHFTKRLR